MKIADVKRKVKGKKIRLKEQFSLILTTITINCTELSQKKNS